MEGNNYIQTPRTVFRATIKSLQLVAGCMNWLPVFNTFVLFMGQIVSFRVFVCTVF